MEKSPLARKLSDLAEYIIATGDDAEEREYAAKLLDISDNESLSDAEKASRFFQLKGRQWMEDEAFPAIRARMTAERAAEWLASEVPLIDAAKKELGRQVAADGSLLDLYPDRSAVLLATAVQVKGDRDHCVVYFRCAHLTSAVVTGTAEWKQFQASDPIPWGAEGYMKAPEAYVRALVHDHHVERGLLRRDEEGDEPPEAVVL